MSLPKTDKIVVFDVDETLGYFTQFGIFWDALNTYYSTIQITNYDTQHNEQYFFNSVLDLYPEFLRVNIIPILNYLKHKKDKKKCKQIMIYTNNHAPKEWINNIINYFHDKIKYKLFDKIIRAFKVHGKIIEFCRTSNNKLINDFFNCTKIPSNSEICFIDDVYYSNMVDDNVYYIKLKPYIYILQFTTMIERFINSKYGNKLNNINDFTEFMNNYINKYNFHYIKKDEKEYELDKIISKKIMLHLQTFFDNDWQNIDNKDDIIIKNNKNNKNKKNVKHIKNIRHTKKYYTNHHNKTIKLSNK
jgi:hypothetical protein